MIVMKDIFENVNFGKENQQMTICIEELPNMQSKQAPPNHISFATLVLQLTVQFSDQRVSWRVFTSSGRRENS